MVKGREVVFVLEVNATIHFIAIALGRSSRRAVEHSEGCTAAGEGGDGDGTGRARECRNGRGENKEEGKKRTVSANKNRTEEFFMSTGLSCKPSSKEKSIVEVIKEEAQRTLIIQKAKEKRNKDEFEKQKNIEREKNEEIFRASRDVVDRNKIILENTQETIDRVQSVIQGSKETEEELENLHRLCQKVLSFDPSVLFKFPNGAETAAHT